MAKYGTRDLRNVALIGHNGSGKTSLADMMLFEAGAVPRRGTVEEGTSIFDYLPEEQQRKVSLETAAAYAEWKGRRITVLDTPGYQDLIGQTIMALRAAETAVLCVNAQDGIMVNTRKVWEEAVRAGVRRVIMVTKIDLDNLDLPRLFAELRETFGPASIPVMFPDGTGSRLGAVLDGVRAPDRVGDSWRDLAREAREKVIEADDVLLEQYLEGKEPSEEEIRRAYPKAIAQGKLVPILCCSVVKAVGIREWLDFVAENLPSPEGRRVSVQGGAGPASSFEVKEGGPVAAQVFKYVDDPFVRNYVYFKVFGGTLKGGMSLKDPSGGESTALGNLFRPFGQNPKNASEVVAGEIAVATKVEKARISQTLGEPGLAGSFEPLTFPAPMISLAVLPKTKKDEAKLHPALEKLAEADPTFTVRRDAQTGDLVVTGMSQLHLDFVLNRMKRVYGVEVTTQPPKVAFKETILGGSPGHYKHKKQTGGHGQYGEVYLRIEPAARGTGLEFVDEIKGGKIPSQYIPSVQKGVQSAMDRGILAGYPIVDVRCTVYDGSYHEVDSDNYSFEIAGYKAFLDAFMKAKPVLLEPIVNLEVSVPAEKQGAVNAQINSKRGIIQSMDSLGRTTVIRAKVPLMEVLGYGSELTSITGGEGTFSMEFSHYDVLPQRVAEEIIRKARAAREQEQG